MTSGERMRDGMKKWIMKQVHSHGQEAFFEGSHISKSLFSTKVTRVVFSYSNQMFIFTEGPQSILKLKVFTLSDLVQIYGHPNKWLNPKEYV